MRELTRLLDLKLLRHGEPGHFPSVLLIASTECGVCASFKDVYKKLEERIGNCCHLYIIVAERVGGPSRLGRGFRKEFGRGYQGYPSLFIVTEQDMQEIPYHSVMLDTKSGRFDDKRMAQYVKRYLLERKIA